MYLHHDHVCSNFFYDYGGGGGGEGGVTCRHVSIVRMYNAEQELSDSIITTQHNTYTALHEW